MIHQDNMTTISAVFKEVFVDTRIYKYFADQTISCIVMAIIVRLFTLLALNNISLFIGIFQESATLYTKLLPTVIAQIAVKILDAMGATQSQIEQSKELKRQNQLAEHHHKISMSKMQAICEYAKADQSMSQAAKQNIVDIATTEVWPPIDQSSIPICRDPKREQAYKQQWDATRSIVSSNYGSV